MEQRKLTKRRAIPTQMRKLVDFVAKHPELNGFKQTSEFKYADARKLWLHISTQLNSMGGPKKTWRQWKKTWQDLKSKKKQSPAASTAFVLSAAEQEALGIKSLTTSNFETEFIQLENQVSTDNNFTLEETNSASLSEPESPGDSKTFLSENTFGVTEKSSNFKVNSSKICSGGTPASNVNGLGHNSCEFNCEMLAAHEQAKVKLKEDYISFKKDYLRQKLELLKEQTEALKSIAKALGEKECNSV